MHAVLEPTKQQVGDTKAMLDKAKITEPRSATPPASRPIANHALPRGFCNAGGGT
jgi:hypothetical protein